MVSELNSSRISDFYEYCRQAEQPLFEQLEFIQTYSVRCEQSMDIAIQEEI